MECVDVKRVETQTRIIMNGRRFPHDVKCDMKELWLFTKKYKKDIFKPVDIGDIELVTMEKSRIRELVWLKKKSSSDNLEET